MFQWFRKLLCFHTWRYYVRASGKVGEPHTWRECADCGHRVIENLVLEDDRT